ncbi:MAG: hypothetical protein JRJ85_13090, partial [Deltaproteobacteria bacterium]|nr:hypothetical protein [Deltaproteobacteria bacterium]
TFSHGLTLAVVLPDEYPLSPPRIFALEPGSDQKEVVLDKFYRWSSLFSMKDILEDLRKEKPRLFNAKQKTSIVRRFFGSGIYNRKGEIR